MGDEDLISLAQKGDVDAQEAMIRRHWGLVKLKARRYFIPGADREDLIQEGLLGLMKGIRDFRASGGSSFRGFADLCVTRQMITAVKAATRQKHSALNQSYSLNAPLGADRDGQCLLELLPAHASPEEELHAADSQLKSIAKARELLSRYEFEVMRLYLAGFSYDEIATIQGKTLKSVDNAVFKVKHKLRRHSRSLDSVIIPMMELKSSASS